MLRHVRLPLVARGRLRATHMKAREDVEKALCGGPALLEARIRAVCLSIEVPEKSVRTCKLSVIIAYNLIHVITP